MVCLCDKTVASVLFFPLLGCSFRRGWRARFYHFIVKLKCSYFLDGSFPSKEIDLRHN